MKRHLTVDTLEFFFFTYCTPANVSDDVGLIEMLTLNINYFKSKPVNLSTVVNLNPLKKVTLGVLNIPQHRCVHTAILRQKINLS